MPVSAERIPLLTAFSAAWNEHDLDTLMSMMTEECEYFSAAGEAATGRRYRGQSEVREGYAAVFASYPDAAWTESFHVVDGARGFSEWLFIGTSLDGQQVRVRGCDLFVFDGDKIKVKDSYRKQRT